ncbi:replicase [viral metagenome]|uniref:Replicase n=1 Tax=viral metagenome TaxID=1070528 RepID=A0A6L2ZK45_9ZZZZ
MLTATAMVGLSAAWNFPLLPPPVAYVTVNPVRSPSALRKLRSGKTVTGLGDGYCYLYTVPRDLRLMAVRDLGCFPRTSDVREWVGDRMVGTHLGHFNLSLMQSTRHSHVYHLALSQNERKVGNRYTPKALRFISNPTAFSRLGSSNALQKIEASVTVPEHLFNLQTDQVVAVRSLREKMSCYSKYQLSSAASAYLALRGIPIDPLAPGNHSHPTSKTLEHYLLEIVLPPILDNHEFTATSMKRHKFDALKRKVKQAPDDRSTLVNYNFDAKDPMRYGTETPLPPVQPIDTEYAFWMDSIHHMNPAEVLDVFRRSPNLNVWVATVIIPPELLWGVRNATTPAYSYNVEGEVMHYAPDGVISESYTQPTSSTWLLETGSMVDAGLALSITTLWNVGPIHLISITRGLPISDRTTHISIPGSVRAPISFLASHTGTNPFVCQQTYEATLSFAQTAINPTPRTIAAKVKTYTSDTKSLYTTPLSRQLILDMVLTAQGGGRSNPHGVLAVNHGYQLLTRRGPILWLRNLLRAGSLYAAMQDGNQQLGNWNTSKRTHFRRIQLNGSHKLSPQYLGMRRAASMAEARATAYSCLYPPTKQAMPDLSEEELQGLGELHTISPYVSPVIIAYATARIAHVVDKRALAQRILRNSFRTLKFFYRLPGPERAVLTPVAVLAASFAAVSTYAIFRAAARLIDGAVQHQIQHLTGHLVRRSRWFRKLDFTVHKLFAPPEGAYLYRPFGSSVEGDENLAKDGDEIHFWTEERDFPETHYDAPASDSESEKPTPGPSPKDDEPVQPPEDGGDPQETPAPTQPQESMRPTVQLLKEIASNPEGRFVSGELLEPRPYGVFYRAEGTGYRYFLHRNLPKSPPLDLVKDIHKTPHFRVRFEGLRCAGADKLNDLSRPGITIIESQDNPQLPRILQPFTVGEQRLAAWDEDTLNEHRRYVEHAKRPCTQQPQQSLETSFTSIVHRIVASDPEPIEMDCRKRGNEITGLDLSRVGDITLLCLAERGSEIQEDGSWNGGGMPSVLLDEFGYVGLDYFLPPTPYGVIEVKNATQTLPDVNYAVERNANSTYLVWDQKAGLFGLGREPPPPQDRARTCLLDAYSVGSGRTFEDVWSHAVPALGLRASEYSRRPFPLGLHTLKEIAYSYHERVRVTHDEGEIIIGKHSDPVKFELRHHNHHWAINRVQKRARRASPKLTDLLIEQCRSHTGNYRINLKRAKHAYLGLTTGEYGSFLKGNTEFQRKVGSLLDAPPPTHRRNIRATGTYGDPGSGKTYPLAELCKVFYQEGQAFDEVGWVTYTDKLREYLANDFNLPDGKGYVVRTWEVALTQPLPETVILDDCGLLPPYLDLLLLLNPRVKTIIATGDPCQNTTRVDTAVPKSSYARETVEIMAPYVTDYLRDSWRLAEGVSGSLGVQGSTENEGRIRRAYQTECPTIVSTRGTKATLNELGCDTMTSVNAQGSTIKGNYNYLIDRYTMLASDRCVYTALTRGKRNINVYFPGSKLEKLTQPASRILRGLISYLKDDDDQELHAAVRAHKLHYTPAQLLDPLRLPGVTPPPLHELLDKARAIAQLHGGDNGEYYNEQIAQSCRAVAAKGSFLEKREETLWQLGKRNFNEHVVEPLIEKITDLNLHYGHLRQPDIDGWKVEEPMSQLRSDHMPKTLLSEMPYPTSQLFSSPETCSELAELLYPEAQIENREVSFAGKHTEQVDTRDRATAIFLQHRRNDRATCNWTFQERFIPTARPSLTYLGGGIALYEAFKRTYAFKPPPFNESVYDAMVAEDFAKLAEKGPKQLEKISYRNSADCEPYTSETFLKGQHVTKLGTEYRKAKKGQMVTGFPTQTNARFGAMTRYLFAAVRSALPEEILLLNGVTLQEQEDWFKQHWNFDKPCYEDDYTAFDGTQNEDFLVFQVMLMSECITLDQLIDEYIEHMTEVKVHGKRSRPFIASGYKFTWLINTLDNMAYQSVKHRLTPHTPEERVARAFSGDDSIHNELVSIRECFMEGTHQYRLVSTGAHSEYPRFCGTLNLPTGTFANPELMVLRIIYRLRKGSLSTAVLGYAEHVSRLHAVLETTQPFLTERQLMCHTISFRILRRQLLINGFAFAASYFVAGLRSCFNMNYSDEPVVHYQTIDETRVSNHSNQRRT